MQLLVAVPANPATRCGEARRDARALVQPWRRTIELLRAWRMRARSREELATMDERMLTDIGLTRSAALFEASKPFWRA